jgi:hypothetical protein
MATKERKGKEIKGYIIIKIIIISLALIGSACSNSRDVIYQYQRGGVRPCGVCK